MSFCIPFRYICTIYRENTKPFLKNQLLLRSWSVAASSLLLICKSKITINGVGWFLMTVNIGNGKRISARGVNNVLVPFNISNKTVSPEINFNIILTEGSKGTCCVGIKIKEMLLISMK